MKPSLLILLILAALPAAGCASQAARTPSNFGLALDQDLAAQIVEPQGAAGPAPPANGPRSALAVTRYQTGKTLAPTAASSQVGKSAAPSGNSGGP